MEKGATFSVYFKNLDGIRFIAALMVLMGHTLRPIYHSFDLGNGMLFQFLETICNGELGVSVFFVLSGFLITYLLLKEHQTFGKIQLRDFYIRRMLRIWPLYFLIVAFTFGIYPFIKIILDVNNPLASRFWMHLLFLSNFDVIRVQHFFTGCDALSQNITWSVSIEEQFYLVWPLVFVLLPKRGWLPVICGLVLASIAFRCSHLTDKAVLYYHTFSVMVDLAMGGMAAYLAVNSQRIRTFFENTGTSTLSVFILFAFTCVWASPSIYKIPYGEAISRLIIGFSFTLFITSQALTKVDSKLQLQHWRFAGKWGKYTYGIYLIHPVVITLSAAALKTFELSSEIGSSILVALITFPLTFLLSHLSFKYYESFFLRLKQRFEKVRTPY